MSCCRANALSRGVWPQGSWSSAAGRPIVSPPARPSRRCAHRCPIPRRPGGMRRRTAGSGCAASRHPSAAPACRGLVVLGERPAQRAVEDVARRHAQRVLQVGRGLGLDARPAVRVGHQHVPDGFGQNRIQRREHRIGQSRPHVVGVGSIIRSCGACRPNTVRVCAPEARSCSDRIVGSVSEWQ